MEEWAQKHRVKIQIIRAERSQSANRIYNQIIMDEDQNRWETRASDFVSLSILTLSQS